MGGPDIEHSAQQIWERIKSSFDPVILTEPLRELSPIEEENVWRMRFSEIQERFIWYRDQFFSPSNGIVGSHTRVELEVSDGGSPVTFKRVMGDHDALNWDQLLEGKSIGDSASLTQKMPLLPYQHPLSSWSGTTKKLAMTIKGTEESLFNSIKAPVEPFNWSTAPKVIPLAIFNCCQQIPWDQIPRFRMSLEEWLEAKRVDVNQDPIWLMTLKLLENQSQHPLRIRGWITGVLHWSDLKNENEARCRFMVQLIENALFDTERIAPHALFRETCKVLVEELGRGVDLLLGQYERNCQSAIEHFALEGKGGITANWCKTRQSVLEANERFMTWLSQQGAFSLVIKSRQDSWDHYLKESDRVRESLSHFLMGSDNIKRERRQKSGEVFREWLQCETAKPILEDARLLSEIRSKRREIPEAFKLLELPVDIEKVRAGKDGIDLLERLEKRLKRVTLKPFPSTEKWPDGIDDFETRMDTFLKSLARIGAIQLLAESKPDKDPGVENLRKRMKEFKWSFDRPLGGNLSLSETDLELVRPLYLYEKPDEVRTDDLRACWAALSGLTRKSIAQLLVCLPKMGGMLQDIMALGNLCNEHMNFHVPQLWAMLSEKADEYKRDSLPWVSDCIQRSKKQGLDPREADAYLEKACAVIVLDELLQDMHEEMVDSFWTTYRNVTEKVLGSNIKNPNAQRVLRFFLRNGALFTHESVIEGRKYREMVASCPASTEEVSSPINLSMILHVDEMLSLVYRGEMPGNHSFERELEFESNQELKKQDQEERRKWRMSLILKVAKEEVKWENIMLLKSQEEGSEISFDEERIENFTKLQRILLELEERYESMKDEEYSSQEKTTLLDNEVQFIRQQSKFLSGKKEDFLPFSIIDANSKASLRVTWKKCHEGLKQLRNRNYREAYDVLVKGYKDRAHILLRPLVILLPANGQDGNCVQARSSTDLGRLVLPVFRQPNHHLYDLILRAYSSYVFDSDKEQGMLEDAQSMLAQYTAYRWESLHKQREAYEGEGFFKRLSDRNNFKFHFSLYLGSEGGKKLKSKSKALHELFFRKMPLQEGMMGFSGSREG